MTKEEFTSFYPCTLFFHKEKIDEIFLNYKRLNPPDSDKLTIDKLKEIMNFFRKKATNYIEKAIADKDNISKNENFDTSEQSLIIFRELLLDYKEALILSRFPELLNNSHN